MFRELLPSKVMKYQGTVGSVGMGRGAQFVFTKQGGEQEWEEH